MIWLTKKDLERTVPAEVAALRSPIPMQMISNGEFLPARQTVQQRHVEERIKELADGLGGKLGLNRRRFLQTSCGMAAAFLAMNAVYGSVFSVDPAEAADPEAAAALAWSALGATGRTRPRAIRRRAGRSAQRGGALKDRRKVLTMRSTARASCRRTVYPTTAARRGSS